MVRSLPRKGVASSILDTWEASVIIGCVCIVKGLELLCSTDKNGIIMTLQSFILRFVES